LLVTYVVAPLVESRYATLLWFDAFGLALVMDAKVTTCDSLNRDLRDVGDLRGR
jgi:hypothetical protein